MKNLKLYLLISLIALLFSSNIQAETYPATIRLTYTFVDSVYFNATGTHVVYGIGQQPITTACSITTSSSKLSLPWGIGSNGTSFNSCRTESSGGITLTWSMLKTCPGGGQMLSDPTYSSICSAAPNCASGQYRATSGANTGTCQNEPTCTAPQVLNTTTHTCDTPPVTCTPPETPDGFGGCAVTECTSQQILNTTSGACQTPPTCGSTEKYNNATNTCFLSTLQCPEHSHASSGNDQCLPDAPLACPTGQHDDGTYTCIANDATRCSTNQYDGEINGQKACINKPNLDTAQKAAQDNAAATQAAENAALQDRLEYYSARDAYLSAQAASDADPLDTAKAAAAASALGTMQTKESELATSESTAQTAQSNQQKAEQSYQSETTRSIDRNTSDISAKQDTTNATLSSIDTTLKQTGSLGTGDMTTGIDSLGSTASNALDNSSEVTQTGSWFDAVPTMPEPGGCVTIPMNFKALQYTLDPCDKLAAFRDMFAYFLYIATTIFIIRIAVRQ